MHSLRYAPVMYDTTRESCNFSYVRTLPRTWYLVFTTSTSAWYRLLLWYTLEKDYAALHLAAK